jgi:hypothetical protein
MRLWGQANGPGPTFPYREELTSMNAESLRGTPNIPLPKGEETEAWIFDATPLAWLRKTWPTRQCPYKYSPAGQIVRKVMPRNGLVRYENLVARLVSYIERDRADINERFNFTDELTDEQVATVLLATVLVERGTTFSVYNIRPDGRTAMFYRLRCLMAWHPDSPKGARP